MTFSNFTTRLLLAIGLTAIMARFIYSGIHEPLNSENIEQVWEEFAPLRYHLDDGVQLEITNPRQYGPVFFLVCEPLWILAQKNKEVFSRYLYFVGLGSVFGAFCFFLQTIRLAFAAQFQQLPSREFSFLIGLFLVCLWIGSSPLLYILNVKNVESWELFLISLALYCRQRNYFFGCGLCIAAASLIKILPVVFIFYFFLFDRKMFFYSLISLAFFLACFTFYYNFEMGILYPFLMAKASFGNTWGAFHMENLSLKGFCLKIFFGWKIAPNSILFTTPGDLNKAIFLAHACQFLAGLLWLAILLIRRSEFVKGSWGIAWEWSWVAIGLLVLSPQTAFEYAVLAQGSIGFAITLYLLEPRIRSFFSTCMLVFGVLLVVNIVPRFFLNWLFGISYLNQRLGNSHLTGSEGYQLYGFPLFGLLAFLIFLALAKIHSLKFQPCN